MSEFVLGNLFSLIQKSKVSPGSLPNAFVHTVSIDQKTKMKFGFGHTDQAFNARHRAAALANAGRSDAELEAEAAGTAATHHTAVYCGDDFIGSLPRLP